MRKIYVLVRKICQLFIRLQNCMSSYSIVSFSQEGEDMILNRLFGGQAAGFYVDVGAHHPKRFSNTYYFYLLGWKGINIDAMPGSMDAFNKLRPRDINIEKPISDKKEVLTYYAFNEPALNGFSKEVSESRDGLQHYKIEFTKDIETSTLEEVLEQNLPAGQSIDFLSIDVEGLDLEVVKSANLKKYKPRVILVEILNYSLTDFSQNEMCMYLNNQGYDLYAKSVNTVIFKANHF